MKVLFISSTHNKAGRGSIVRMQGESLSRQGVEVYYFGIDRGGFAGYISSIFQLGRSLRRNNVDILHAHYGLSALVALPFKIRFPLVVSFMGDDILGTNNEDGTIRKGSLLLARFNVFLSKWIFTHTIVKSRQMFEKLNHRKASIIANGVNLTLFRPADKAEARAIIGEASTTKLILFLSDPSRVEKNYRLAEKAVLLIGDTDVKLLAVYRHEYLSLVDFYNAADVILLTSFHEGSPNVIKEAMACNRPIVSTDVGDVREITGDTQGCWLSSFEPTDVAKKIEAALMFAEKMKETKGRDSIIRQGLDSDTVAVNILSVYRSVLSGKKIN